MRPSPASSAFSRSTSCRTRVTELAARDADVPLGLRVALQHRRGVGERPTLERAAEEQRGCEPVAGDVAVEIDDVARLLAAEQRRPRAFSASST